MKGLKLYPFIFWFVTVSMSGVHHIDWRNLAIYTVFVHALAAGTLHFSSYVIPVEVAIILAFIVLTGGTFLLLKSRIGELKLRRRWAIIGVYYLLIFCVTLVFQFIAKVDFF